MISLPSIEDALPVVEERTYKARQPIYFDCSTGLFYVHSGIARIFRRGPDGERFHVDFCAAGDLFGASCLYPNPPHEQAIAHSECTVYFWPSATLPGLIEQRPDLSRALLGIALEENARLFDRVIRAETLPVRERLRATLLDLAERLGSKTADGSVAKIQPGITHHVLASMIGTSREMTTFCMNLFRRERLISFNRQALTIYTEQLATRQSDERKRRVAA